MTILSENNNIINLPIVFSRPVNKAQSIRDLFSQEEDKKNLIMWQQFMNRFCYLWLNF